MIVVVVVVVVAVVVVGGGVVGVVCVDVVVVGVVGVVVVVVVVVVVFVKFKKNNCCWPLLSGLPPKTQAPVPILNFSYKSCSRFMYAPVRFFVPLMPETSFSTLFHQKTTPPALSEISKTKE